MAFNSRQILIAVAVVAVVIAGGVFWYVSRSEPVTLASATTTATAAAPAAAAQADSAIMVAGPLGEMGLGDPNAPNIVIEYASMTCPHCQAWHADVWPEFKKQYVDTGKVYFILREYPLDPLATAAIMIARCGPKERYFPLVDLMFDHQREWAFQQNPADKLRDLVKQAGVTPEAFQACLTNQQILDGVNWVKNRGASEFGVQGTPAFFVNGKMLSGEQSLEKFAQEFGS